ncbi:glycosyltransferase, partial [bacterium]|nr:glycosyltransferase [bacterium]
MKIGLSLDEVSLGGGPRFMLDLGRCLVAAGHRAILLPEVPGDWEPLLAAGGLELARAPGLPRATFRGRARALADAWNRAGFDAIVVNVGHLNRLAMCALHFLDARVPVMLVLHGDWESLYSLAEQHLPVWNC